MISDEFIQLEFDLDQVKDKCLFFLYKNKYNLNFAIRYLGIF